MFAPPAPSGGNGRFKVDGSLTFPDQTFGGGCYFIDLVFKEDVPAASGVTIHVAVTGSDTAGNGSAGSPYATPDHAVSLASPGDMVLVADGVFNGSVNVSGARGVTLKAQNPGGARIRSSSGNAVTGSGVGYFTIDGFDTRTTAANCHGVEIERSHHITIKNCISHDNPNSGISLPWGEFYSIENCISYGNGRAGWYSGITLYESRNITGDITTPGPRNVIRNCIAYDNWTIGGSTDGNGFLIDDWNHTQSYGPDPEKWLGVRYQHGGLVENCLAYGNGNKGIGVAWCENITVRNCTCYRNGIDGSQGTWRGDLSNQSGKNCTFVNNIAVCDSSLAGTGANNTAIGNYTSSTAAGFSCAGTIWHNNLTFNLAAPGSNSLKIEGGDATAPLAADGNLFATNPLSRTPRRTTSPHARPGRKGACRARSGEGVARREEAHR